MSAPNLANISTITAKSVQATLNTTLTTEILANAGSSGKVFKVNNILVANIDGTNSANASVAITKSGGSPIMIASTIAVPADSSLVVVDRNTNLYLEEGDNIEAGASANSDLTITINYEELS